MKKKYKWIITLGLMLFICFKINVTTVHAEVMPTYSIDSIVSSFKSAHADIVSGYKNIVFVSSTASYGYDISFFYSNSDILLTKSTGAFGYNAPTTLARGGLYNTTDKWYYDKSSPTALSSYTDLYVIQGANPIINGNSTSSTYAPYIQVSDEDILNYNWDNNGIKIYNLKTGMNVSGYIDGGTKWFDVETYGKFTYMGSNTYFTTIAYKQMQTSIQLASSVTYGANTRKAGEGLGIKSFQWTSDTSKLNTGDEIKFRIVYQVPMLTKGTYDIKIGTTVNDGKNNSYISDYVTGVNFLNSNSVATTDNSGETGNVGELPGNTPVNSVTDSAGSLSSMLTMFSSFSAFIGTMFGFLPTEVKVLFVGACTIITGLMIKRAVL